MTALSTGRSICLLNGSLRLDRSSSFHFLNGVEKQLTKNQMPVTRLSVQPGAAHLYPAETPAVLCEAAAVALASPLYGYCLPGGPTHLLEAWAAHASQHPQRPGTRFYGIINCAFVVPETMTEAIRVLRHFCARVGLDYRFSIAIASGLVAVLTEPVDLRLKRAYRAIADDIRLESHEARPDIYLRPLVPRIVMDTIREYLDARVQRSVREAAVLQSDPSRTATS